MSRCILALSLAVGVLPASDARASGAVVVVGGHVVVTGGGGAGLAGVEVCVTDRRACVTSDATGKFGVRAPATSEAVLMLSKAGHGSVAMGIATSAADEREWVIGMSTDAALSERNSAIAAAHPAEHTGHLVAIASPPDRELGVEGVTFSLNPPSGKGAFYAEPNGVFSNKRDRTSSWSAGLFIDVSPGEVELVYGAPGSCTPSFGGWPSRRANAVRVPIVAGFETHVSMVCKLRSPAGEPREGSP